jgi:soluble lytic murein transglycosylase-like protein
VSWLPLLPTWLFDDKRRGDRRERDRRTGARASGDRRQGDRRAAAPRVALLTSLFLAFAGSTARGSTARAQVVLDKPPASTLSGRVPGFRKHIESAAAKHGISPALIEAVIRVESGFRPRAVSRKGAQGLMQLMPATAAQLGVKDVFDPEQNIHAGTRYLAVLLRLFEGDVSLACAAYNAGVNTVRRFGGIPPYPETQQYVKRIARLLDGRDGAPVMAVPDPPKKKNEVFYLWYDEKGILNVSQFAPPEGTPYQTMRPGR